MDVIYVRFPDNDGCIAYLSRGKKIDEIVYQIV